MTKDEIVRDLAIKKVCPLSMEPQTAYEHNMVRQLTQFGLAVLDAVEHRVHWTIATCAPEYHASLDEEGDRFCRMCGQPLSQ